MSYSLLINKKWTNCSINWQKMDSNRFLPSLMSKSHYDPIRLDVFMSLFDSLQRIAPTSRLDAHMTDRGKTNLAFFEAYFSNYIEGTEFLVEEAMDIVFHGCQTRQTARSVQESG
jgi:hypothetical protein